MGEPLLPFRLEAAAQPEPAQPLSTPTPVTTTLLWPIPGGPNSLLGHIYNGEAWHLAHEGAIANDFCNCEGIALRSPFLAEVAAGTGADPHRADNHYHAGNVVVLEGTYRARHLRIHFCHLEYLEVSRGTPIHRGQVFGHVGHTGTFVDESGELMEGTQPLAHCHNFIEEEQPDGSWKRVSFSSFEWES